MMNISKPTKFQHNIHVHLKVDPETGNHVLVHDEPKKAKDNEMTISNPTEFKHNLHGKVDPDTKQLILCSPSDESFISRDENSYDCNNCQESYIQWRKDQVKIKELQEENHSMIAMSARLYRLTSGIYNSSWDPSTFRCSSNPKPNLREFEENMEYTAHSLFTITNRHIQSEDVIQQLTENIHYMNKEIVLLEDKLREAHCQMTAAKTEFDERAERAEKELKKLKPHFIELQNDNERLSCKLRDLTIWFKELHSNSSKISSSLHGDMSYRQLRKENESLKSELQHVEDEKNRLDEEQSSTIKQLFKNAESHSNHQSRCSEDQDIDQFQSTDLDRYKINEYCRGKNITAGKHVSYNIHAKAVNIIEKSGAKYDEPEWESADIQETEQTFQI